MKYECARCGFSNDVARIAGCGRPFEGNIVTACPMVPISSPGPLGTPPIVWAVALIAAIALVYFLN